MTFVAQLTIKIINNKLQIITMRSVGYLKTKNKVNAYGARYTPRYIDFVRRYGHSEEIIQ